MRAVCRGKSRRVRESVPFGAAMDSIAYGSFVGEKECRGSGVRVGGRDGLVCLVGLPASDDRSLPHRQ
jgi:hypothetical protein